MATDDEKKIGHDIIAKLFDLKVRDMGGGLRIVSPTPAWWPIEQRDLIVKAISEFIRR